MAVRLPKHLRKALKRSSKLNRRSISDEVTRIISENLSPYKPLPPAELRINLDSLAQTLASIPAVSLIAHDVWPDGQWWIKFNIDPGHKLAWRTVQELGFVLNYISLDDRLPTVFMPLSPPPYLNGGVEFLAWVVESRADHVDPKLIQETLEGRLPNPIHDTSAWSIDT